MDRAVDTAAPEQGRVGGVDDGVNAEFRDVGDQDFEPYRAEVDSG